MSEPIDSILTSVKKTLGIEKDYEQFDADLIMHINSVFSILTELGIGPKEGFSITGPDEVWDDYLKDSKKIDLVKSYMYLKVKLIFDPPLSTAVLDVMNREVAEFEWRLNVAVDPGEED